MDLDYGIQIIKAYQDLLALAPIISKAEGRKLQIKCCLKEYLEENMDCA